MIERLRIFIDNQCISIRAFEIKIGASDGMIRRAINNGTDIQSKWLTNIADNYPQLNLEWLITGRGEMFSTNIETKCAEKAINQNDGINDGFFDGIPNVHKRPSCNDASSSPTIIYRDDPLKDEIIALQKKNIALLEQQVSTMAEQIADLKKELPECGFVYAETYTPAVPGVPTVQGRDDITMRIPPEPTVGVKRP